MIVLLAAAMFLGICGCSPKVVLDYGNAEAFEAALNRGENLEGKIVSFVAKELHPDSKLGYNIWAGEHLNFVSSRNPDIKEGSTVTVKTKTIENLLGSWVISYEVINNAIVGETTIINAEGPLKTQDETEALAATDPSEKVSVSLEPSVILDYADAESFEAALNNGENLEGKTVAFVAKELHPDSKLGYNVWAGEHLNFVSSRNPDIKEGTTVTVRATEIENMLGSWIIRYELITNAEMGENIISSGTGGVKKEQLPLELVETGICVSAASEYSDTAYLNFVGKIFNPNTDYSVDFPDLIVTLKTPEGQIIATEDQMGMTVMPGDTITLVGLISAPVADINADTKVEYELDYNDYSEQTDKTAKTTDFRVENVSERSSDMNHVTGEITNTTEKEIDSINLSMVLRKNGEIVYACNTFIDDMKPEKAKAFEFTSYQDWPEHDDIEISAQEW